VLTNFSDPFSASFHSSFPGVLNLATNPQAAEVPTAFGVDRQILREVGLEKESADKRPATDFVVVNIPTRSTFIKFLEQMLIMPMAMWTTESLIHESPEWMGSAAN